MSQRMMAWARKEKVRLVAMLGAKCAACGRESDLEFDCMEPQGHNHHRKNLASRICFYRRQLRQGNIQLLCAVCNNLKGDMPLASWLSWLSSRREKLYLYTRIRGCEQREQVSSLLARKNFEEASL